MNEFGDISEKGIFQDALRFRDEGNFLMRAKEYVDATKSYRKSIECLNVIANHSADNGEAKTLRATVQANAAQALIKLERYEDALVASDNCLSIDPKHKKALFRRAKALFLLERYEDAQESVILLLQKYSEGEEKPPKDVEVLYIDIRGKLAGQSEESLHGAVHGSGEGLQMDSANNFPKSMASDSTKCTANRKDASAPVKTDSGMRLRQAIYRKQFEKSIAKKLVTGGLYTDKPAVDKDAFGKQKKSLEFSSQDNEPKEVWESAYDSIVGFVRKLLCCRRKPAAKDL